MLTPDIFSIRLPTHDMTYPCSWGWMDMGGSGRDLFAVLSRYLPTTGVKENRIGLMIETNQEWKSLYAPLGQFIS
jgi:hypothetical protein